MRDFAGRVAVVTGAGSGIGRALAFRFAAEGMKVALTDIEDKALEETRSTLAESGTEVTARPVDVGDGAAVRAFADHVYETFGAVHILCNNAGVFTGGQMWTRPFADFEWMFRVNTFGVLHGVHAFVPRMIEQDTEGHVVNTASVAGLFAAPFTGGYAMTKFATYAATEALAHEFAVTGSKLRASVLCPGGVHTRIHEADRNRPADLPTEHTADQELIDEVISNVTTRGIPPEEVADAVVAAIRDETFLILTHESYRPGLVRRARSLAEGRLPDLPDFESRG
ncbi:SDR family NAD(P)-dependent oxidoreductase [Actinomadura kijaniata]|uniref:SDR family NAD(P)-dependent oxidoreductase n=1 Tax=Actinomadura kijaniata TaxID=46161 RepID=UPI0008344A88|nr:SDR family NAD(P)-dependent oxidoreductase [Actinomadura kijaniata]